MISKERKAELITKYGNNPQDTGKPEVQIALLTEEINTITDHLKEHKKDVPSRRALLKKVAQRRHLLDYLTRNDVERYKAIIADLGLRK
jgi:small subunit ribosomal protein S15